MNNAGTAIANPVNDPVDNFRRCESPDFQSVRFGNINGSSGAMIEVTGPSNKDCAVDKTWFFIPRSPSQPTTAKSRNKFKKSLPADAVQPNPKAAIQSGACSIHLLNPSFNFPSWVKAKTPTEAAMQRIAKFNPIESANNKS